MTGLVLKRVFDWKVRGVRWIEIIGVLMVAAMVFSVYLAKTAAAREGNRIAALEREIADTRQRVRLLRAETTRLEQPARLEALSRQIGLVPLDARREATTDDLARIAPKADAQPAPVASVRVDPAEAEIVDEGAMPPVDLVGEDVQ